MSSSRSTRAAVVVGLFEQEAQAREAADALRHIGVADQQLGLLRPGEALGSSAAETADTSGLLALASSAGDSSDARVALMSLGVPAGEARFYAEEAHEGRTLLVAAADGNRDSVRKLVLEHGGYDARSRGRELARPDRAGQARRHRRLTD